MFKNISLKGKLLGICLTLAMFSTLLGGVGIFALRGVVHKYHAIATVNLPNAVNLGQMFADFRLLRTSVLTLATQGLTDEHAKTALEKIQKAKADYLKHDKEFNAVPFMPGEDELYKPVNEVWKSYSETVDRIVAAYNDPVKRPSVYATIQNEELAVGTTYGDRIEKLIAFHEDSATRRTKDATEITEWANTIMVSLAVIAMIVSTTIAVLFSNALGKMLSQLASRLSSGADEVASASTQVSSASESLSSSATEQAAALQETAASVEELSATITKNSENAQESRITSEKSQTVASRGKESMDEMTRAIADIQASTANMVKQIEASNTEIADITKVIGEIGNKTKVINDIVFQTKLLSFNASVEAARAGEHGKGFAVVAEEVGNLAAMSGKSSREISALLESSIQKVQSIVSDSKRKIDELVAQGTEKVAKGTQIAQRCGEVLLEIVDNAASVNNRISQISDASKEQENGVREISKAMEQLNQVTQQNAAASQQAASASSELSAQAEALRGGVTELQMLVYGKKHSAHSSSVTGDSQHEPAKAVASRKSPATTGKSGNRQDHGSSNVVPLNPPKVAKAEALAPLKKAVGSEIPADTDPRFTDI